MDLMKRVQIIDNDFEVVDRLKKLNPPLLIEGIPVLKFLEKNGIGKDVGIAFEDHKHSYIVYKYGESTDSGLLMVCTIKSDTFILKSLIEINGHLFPNPVIRMAIMSSVKAILLRNGYS